MWLNHPIMRWNHEFMCWNLELIKWASKIMCLTLEHSDVKSWNGVNYYGSLRTPRVGYYSTI